MLTALPKGAPGSHAQHKSGCSPPLLQVPHKQLPIDPKNDSKYPHPSCRYRRGRAEPICSLNPLDVLKSTDMINHSSQRWSQPGNLGISGYTEATTSSAPEQAPLEFLLVGISQHLAKRDHSCFLLPNKHKCTQKPINKEEKHACKA